MNLYNEFFALISYLNKLGAKYAVVGGVAMAFHGRARFTRDVDILLHPDDLRLARLALDRLGYRETAEPWIFRNTNLTLHRFLKADGEDEMMMDILLANAPEHQKIIADAVSAKADNGAVKVASKAGLIALKRVRNSDQDQVDIKGLEEDDKNRKERA